MARAKRKKPAKQSREPEAYFRKWLVKRVSESRFATRLNETDEELGERLGVLPSVIREARELQKKERPAAILGRYSYRAKNNVWLVEVEPPTDIFLEWEAHCKRLNVATSLLARSLLHHVLQQTTQPEWLSVRKFAWPWNGKWLVQEKKHQHRIRMEVTEAAHIALSRRAEATRSTMAGIMRWGILSLLSGKIRGLKIVPGLAGLFDDPARYCLNPKIIKMNRE